MGMNAASLGREAHNDRNGGTTAMRIPYRYLVRTIHGAAKLESELTDLSREGWEPISFQRDAAGSYEVILRQEQDEHTQVVLEHLEATVGDIAAPPLTE